VTRILAAVLGLPVLALPIWGLAAAMQPAGAAPAKPAGDPPLSLGNFSVSLAVKDVKASQAFYEKLGFKQFAGNAAQHWLIMQNDTATVGLFQGVIPKSGLTFNPGWDRSAQTLAKFTDVRDLQKELKKRGVEITTPADESSTGPASFVVTDPDGNPVLFDQHVAKGK
jgi:catechol 2,3-dioxygenase-like lactoylglutathione lyase family enzyme